MHDCIRNWIWKYDPVLMKITVWTNLRQGIITILSGEVVGRFHDSVWGFRKKVEVSPQAPKGTFVKFPTFPVFGGW